jgi:hypothetical protein
MAIEDILKAMGAIPEVPLQEEGEHNSETIDYEYVVRFNDGLKPHVVVYGTNQEGKVFGMDVITGFVISNGYAPFEEEGFEGLDPVIRLATPFITRPFSLKEGVTIESLEGKMKTDCFERKTNLIKVKNLSHMETVIGRHVQQYAQQFEEIARSIGDRVYQFVLKEHPEYLGGFRTKEKAPEAQ